MSNLRVIIAFVLAAAFGTAAAAPAAAHVDHPAHPAKAKVTMRAARATALAKTHGGKVESAELEREHGKLVYSFDIRVPGTKGIEEVRVDAYKGTIVSVVHESPKTERQEAKKEKVEAQKHRADTRAKTPSH